MESAKEVWFDHEKLTVYQEAIGFIAWLMPVMEGCERAGDVKEQIDRASNSMPLNIAEGNRKYSAKDRARYFEIALASGLECAACLDVLVARRKVVVDEIREGKRRLQGIVRMLMALIQRNTMREYGKKEEREGGGG